MLFLKLNYIYIIYHNSFQKNALSVRHKLPHFLNQFNYTFFLFINAQSSQLFAMRLEEMSSSISIPKEALWDSYAHVVTHVLVEGFANAKKCSAAGRALMQLDFTHFLSVLVTLSGTKHPQHQQYVDQYIKAFYFGSALEEFITTQKSYSSKHMVGLINCACNDKKLRQKLLNLVESMNEIKN